ncbi:MAG: tetratricopeptide repeat protein [Limisphaerales bacterium]
MGLLRAALLLAFTLWALPLVAADFADPIEKRDFEAAAGAFQDLNYERAEREFGEFVQTWKDSAFKNLAVLRQAQARFHLTNYPGAMSLLTAGLPQAGKLADQYQFWLGETHFQVGSLDRAASTYALLCRDFTNSPHFLAAAHHEALARFKLGQHTNVVALLRAPTGSFQRAARASPTNDLVVSGTLLLGEALLATREFPAAEQAARALGERRLAADVDWQRRFLLGRVLTEAGRTAEALSVVTNLVRFASALNQPLKLAESYALQGTVLEKLGELSAAVASFTNNFTTNAPAVLRQRALAQAVLLSLKQSGKEPETIAMLELFSTQYPTDPSLDLAQLTLGELRVKEFHARASATNAGPTNLLLIAITNLGRVVTEHTNSPRLGQAFYQRGWCRWHLSQPAAAAADFGEAARRLPKSEEQAMARFKLAEAQALQNDHTNALRNFQMVVEQYGDLERVRNAYFDEALYRAMRSAIAVSNQVAADAAFRKIIELFPEQLVSDKATLQFGGELNRQGKPADARRVFLAQLERFPKSELAPQVHLAVARTYRQESDWTNTARIYAEWLKLFPTNSARADVEFENALFSSRADGTNALPLFTNFVAQFKTHSNAPLAQLWIGDHFFSQGQTGFAEAEKNYQLLFQNTNWPDSELKHLARLGAGRAAYERKAFKFATNYFVELVNDERVSKDIQASAFVALGDTYQKSSQEDVVPIALDPLGDAIIAFSRVTNATHFPNCPVAPSAMGRIGDCLFQRAAKNKDSKQLELAGEAYFKTMIWPGADAETRSFAEVALGLVRETQGRPKDALDHWSNVFYRKNLHPGEEPDVDKVKMAGLNLGRLREERAEWPQAIAIYESMQQLFPPLRQPLALKIERARKMLNERR